MPKYHKIGIVTSLLDLYICKNVFIIILNRKEMKRHFIKSITILMVGSAALTSCKVKGCVDETAYNYDNSAEKDDNSCTYVPTTYLFTDENGNNTVSYSGQTDRLNQLSALSAYAKSGKETILDEQALIDMFENTDGNGNGNFTFTSSKQLADKYFDVDVNNMYVYFDSIANISLNNGRTAAPGVSGTVTSGSSSYLVSSGGIEYAQLIEKTSMGAVFMYQALNGYFGADKMNVDNTSAVDAAAGKHYTKMEHHWDEAFGYIGIESNPELFDNNVFWGKYANGGSANYTSASLLNSFSRGRMAITLDELDERDAAITEISNAWARLCAFKAAYYLGEANDYFINNNNAKYLHALSEAYAFIYNLKFVPEANKSISNTEIEGYLNTLGTDFWNISDVSTTLNTIKSDIQSNYNI
jgi:hypothetical protein